jgi:membrane-associated HD superfamily phosphohydrolase
MKVLHRYLWFVSQSFDGLTHFWPVSLALLILVCVAAIFYVRSKRIRPGLRYFLMLLPMLLIIGTLSLAVFMRHPVDSDSDAPSWPSVLITAMFWMYIPLAFFIGHVLKEVRWLAFGIVALQAWYGLWCSLLAAMSVTGNWI